MSAKKILLLFMYGDREYSPEKAMLNPGSTEQRCHSLCKQLGFEIDIRVLSSTSDVSGEIQEITQGINALIVNSENYSGSPDSIAVEELRSFETLADRGIPIVEVHEQNIFQEGDTRPYLDSPGIGAGLVSGMGQGSYLVAIRALASKLESKAV